MIDRAFLQVIHRITLLEFLTHVKNNNDLTSSLFYFHASQFFGRHDLAFVINFIYQLEQTPYPLSQPNQLTLFAILLSKSELLPNLVISKIQTATQEIKLLPNYSNLSNEGKIAFHQFLAMPSFDNKFILTKSDPKNIYTSLIFFNTLFTNFNQIASLLETYEDTLNYPQLFKMNLPLQLRHALAFNPQLKMQLLELKLQDCSTQESMIEYFYAKDSVEFGVPEKFFSLDKPAYSAGLVFRAYLSLGMKKAAQRILLEQNTFGRNVLRYYQNLVSPPQAPLAENKLLWLNSPVTNTIASFLPLQSLFALRATSKRCPDLFKIPKKRLQFFQLCSELGKRYERQLREFRNTHSQHLHYCSADFVMPMLWTFVFSEFLYSFMPSILAAVIRPLVFLISFIVFSDFKKSKKLLDDRPAEVKYQLNRATSLAKLISYLDALCEELLEDPNTPWVEVDRALFQSQLNKTTTYLAEFINLIQAPLTLDSNRKTWLTLFNCSPNNHLYITYRNSFFGREVLTPFKRLLLQSDVPDKFVLRTKALKLYLDTTTEPADNYLMCSNSDREAPMPFGVANDRHNRASKH